MKTIFKLMLLCITTIYVYNKGREYEYNKYTKHKLKSEQFEYEANKIKQETDILAEELRERIANQRYNPITRKEINAMRNKWGLTTI